MITEPPIQKYDQRPQHAGANHDLDVMIQGGQEFHRLFDRELVKTVILQRGYFRLGSPQHFGGFALFEFTCLEQIIDGNRQARLGLMFSRIGQTQVFKDIGRADSNNTASGPVNGGKLVVSQTAVSQKND